MTTDRLGEIAGLIGAVAFPLGATLAYLTPVWYLGVVLLAVGVLALVVVLTALHLRARGAYGRSGTVVFALTLAGIALSINPFTAILGGAILLIAFPWFLVKLVRETGFVNRSDPAPLVGGIAAATILALALEIGGRDAEPALIALGLGTGLMLYRFARALASGPGAAGMSRVPKPGAALD